MHHSVQQTDYAKYVPMSTISANSHQTLFFQMTVSIMRAIGPAAANSLFSLSMEKGYLGGYFVYLVLLLVAAVAMIVASQLPRKLWTS